MGDIGREGQVLEKKYRLERLLGEGGMGQVYEAVHEVLGRKVAIKFLLPDLASNEQVLARFFQEAKIAGSLGHPNICEVTDVGTAEDGAPYMIMPLLRGKSLRDAMKEGLMSLDRIIHIVSQVLSALQRAHDAGIVHRDLKPENVFLVSTEDQRDFVKLLDFGISKVVTDKGANVKSGLTVTGMILGTPYYMAPEQARGQRDIDHRADIYSAGAMLFELLTGRVPFEGENYNEVIVKIVTQIAPTVTQISGRVPPELDDVVARALDPDRDKRFQTAREFKHALIAQATATGLFGGPPREGEEWSDVYSLPGGGGAVRSGVGTSAKSFATSPELPTNRGRSTGLLIGGVVGGLSLLALLGILLLWHPWSRKKEQPQSKNPRAGAVAAPGMGSGTSHAVDAGAARQARPEAKGKVVLTFEVSPKHANLFVDGKVVSGPKLEVEKSDTAMTVEVKADGYVTAKRTVIPTMDTKLVFRLDKEKQTARARTRRGRSTRRSPRSRVVKGRNKTNVVTDYE